MSGFAVGGNILDYLGREKWLKISGGGGRWCQVSEAVWGWLRVDEEIKSPCGDRSFAFWLNLILQSRHLTRVRRITIRVRIIIIFALFRGIGFVAWAGAFTVLIKFITFGGTFVAFVANLSIKIGFAFIQTLISPGCIRPKGNQSSSQHQSFQFHRE